MRNLAVSMWINHTNGLHSLLTHLSSQRIAIRKKVCMDGVFANFIGLSDAQRYDAIWTENGDMIDSFIPDILTLKECSKRIQHVSETCWTYFER